MTAPKKYLKIDGVMQLNPEYKKYMETTQKNNGVGQQQQQRQQATTVYNPNNAVQLPIVSNMDDHAELNQASIDAGGQQIPLSNATNATIEMMQEPDISLESGQQPDEMVDNLGIIFDKYEVPMGLMNKLMVLSEYQSLEFIIDDSGSMSLLSDTFDIRGRPQTRWHEAQGRLKEMMEVIAYVPFSQIDIVFLNRKTHVILTRNGRDPKSFLADAYRQIDQVFVQGPRGSTPALEKLQESLMKGRGKNIARYFFGDGTPNGGLRAQQEITRLLYNRENPEGNPITFLSCTNEDEQVEWMKDAEEVIPYCSESDDYRDEAEEVYRDQGSALPYSRGFHLMCQLVAAMHPDDLDAMDESVPFTKASLDNILGIEHNEESYRHYFKGFAEAQRNRRIEGPTDELKKTFNWEVLYQEFLHAPVARQIPAVQEFNEKLLRQQQSTNTSSSSPSPYNNLNNNNNNNTNAASPYINNTYNNGVGTTTYATTQTPNNYNYSSSGTPGKTSGYATSSSYQATNNKPTVVQGIPTTQTAASHNKSNRTLFPRMLSRPFRNPSKRGSRVY